MKRHETLEKIAKDVKIENFTILLFYDEITINEPIKLSLLVRKVRRIKI